MKGQMSIFDFPEFVQGETRPKCSLVNECDAYPQACGGTIAPCRFGGPYTWSEVMP